MKNNQTLYAAGILVVLALIYFLTQTGNVDTKNIDSDLFAVEKYEVSSVAVNSAENPLEFVRNESVWRVEDYPVDTTRYYRILDQVTSLKVDRLITKNAEKHEKYEVIDSSPMVILKSESGKSLLELIIGKQGANYQETFVRAAGQDEVYAVKSSLGQFKSMTASNFWDRTMTDLDVNMINRVRMEGEYSYMLERQGPVWTFNGEQVDLEKVVNMLKPLENLKGSNFADEISVDKVFYQSIHLGFENGETLDMDFHLKAEASPLLLVKISGMEKIFEYSKSGLNRYKKSFEDLKADPLPET